MRYSRTLAPSAFFTAPWWASRLPLATYGQTEVGIGGCGRR
jgi:hypothetical protein